MDSRFTFAARARSFRHAFRGLARLLRTEPNAWIHAAATLAVVGLGWALGVDRAAWAWLVAAIAAVWVTEALNTAFERLADAVHPDPHPLVRDAKDAAAGAVLLAAAAAVAVGLLVLGPPLLRALGLAG
jgi:diacylglycerol kinase